MSALDQLVLQVNALPRLRAVILMVFAVVALGIVGGWGVLGIWIGLSFGLIVVSTVLVRAWARRTRALPIASDPT